MKIGEAGHSALDWAIKGSLVGYVRAMKDGKIIAQLPAKEIKGGFQFPAAAEASPDGSLRFSGCVRLSGHSGMLNLQFEDPWLVPGDSPSDPWALTIADPYEPGSRLAFATIAQVAFGVEADAGAGAGAGSGADALEVAGAGDKAEKSRADADVAGTDHGHEHDGSRTSLTASGTTLTEDGADLFLSGPYEPGTEFDNPRVVVLD